MIHESSFLSTNMSQLKLLEMRAFNEIVPVLTIPSQVREFASNKRKFLRSLSICDLKIKLLLIYSNRKIVKKSLIAHFILKYRIPII